MSGVIRPGLLSIARGCYRYRASPSGYKPVLGLLGKLPSCGAPDASAQHAKPSHGYYLKYSKLD